MVEAAWPGRNYSEMKTQQPAQRRIFFSQALSSEEKHGVVEAAWPGRNYSEIKTQQPAQRRIFFSQALWSEEKQGSCCL